MRCGDERFAPVGDREPAQAPPGRDPRRRRRRREQVEVEVDHAVYGVGLVVRTAVDLVRVAAL
jgi:hypothetical protein